jgi:hypothetical protein
VVPSPNHTTAVARYDAEQLLSVQVHNSNMGGDPAVGADKVLTVIYRYNRREQSTTAKEGNALRIPWSVPRVAGEQTLRAASVWK